MRIARIPGIHANLVALKAVVDYIEQNGVDQNHLFRRHRDPRAMPWSGNQGAAGYLHYGNHDAFLIDPELIHTYTEAPVIVEAVDWCRHPLS